MNKKEILESNFKTISNCDSKAASLLTAVGIIFSFSMFSISDLSNTNGWVLKLIHIFGIAYIVVFIAIISILVSIIFPRRRNKKEKKVKVEYQLYSEDLFNHIKKNDFENFVDVKNNDKGLLDQIKVCTRIAHTKENLLMVSSLLTIVFAIILTALIVLLFL